MMAELGKEMTETVMEIADSLDDQAERDKRVRARFAEIEAAYQAKN